MFRLVCADLKKLGHHVLKNVRISDKQRSDKRGCDEVFIDKSLVLRVFIVSHTENNLKKRIFAIVKLGASIDKAEGLFLKKLTIKEVVWEMELLRSF